MNHTPQAADAREAEDMGEKPDTGRTPDALAEALSGSGMGSDTPAGSLQGGVATGSEIDHGQDAVNETLTREGMAANAAAAAASAKADPDPVKNTGEDSTGPEGEADAATG